MWDGFQMAFFNARAPQRFAAVRLFPILKRRNVRRCYGILLLLLSFPFNSAPAYAYFDPNASTLLFQLLAPLMAAATSVWLLGVEKIYALIASVKRKLFSWPKPATPPHVKRPDNGGDRE
jgi:hypothetical protein